MNPASPYGSRVLHAKGTLRETLHKIAETTLSKFVLVISRLLVREGIASAVVCPEDVDVNEWIAAHGKFNRLLVGDF